MSGPLPLSNQALAIAASLVLINGMLSVWLRLGLERSLAVATLRTIVQLSLLGFILEPVFTMGEPWLIAAMVLVMLSLSGWEATRRLARKAPGVATSAMVGLTLGAGAATMLATTAVIRPEPWWTPQYVIPLLGMLLGNALTGVALGLDHVLARIESDRAEIELMLGFGAGWWDAIRPISASAIRTGMIPIINSMNVVGLVTIPGMTTGQILAGSSPTTAVRYQMMIMFLIAGSVAIGSGVSVLLVSRAAFDAAGRLKEGWSTSTQ